MQDKQTAENTKLINFRLPISQYIKLEKLALRNERDISKEVRFVINKYIELNGE